MNQHTIVLFLAGLLVILIHTSQVQSAPQVIPGPSKEENLTSTRMSTLSAIVIDLTTNGVCPQSLDGLNFSPMFRPKHMPEVYEQNQIKQYDDLLVDAWGNKFRYHIVTNAVFTIHSPGLDGQDYTPDDIKITGNGRKYTNETALDGTEFVNYVVDQDWDLHMISLLYDVPVETLQQLNGITNTALHPGQVVKVPLTRNANPPSSKTLEVNP